MYEMDGGAFARDAKVCPSQVRSPDDEVVPGVRWGRSGWVGSPAYWSMLAATEDPADDYIRRDGCPLHYEVAFCLLGGFGIRMEVNEAAYTSCLEHGLLEPGRRAGSSDFENVLSVPMTVRRRSVRYRFPRQRSRRLADALRAIEDSPPPTATARGFRSALLAVPGIGPKAASWIAPNWLGADDVAIIDVQVMRAGVTSETPPGPDRTGRQDLGQAPGLPRTFLRAADFRLARSIRASLSRSAWRRAARRRSVFSRAVSAGLPGGRSFGSIVVSLVSRS